MKKLQLIILVLLIQFIHSEDETDLYNNPDYCEKLDKGASESVCQKRKVEEESHFCFVDVDGGSCEVFDKEMYDKIPDLADEAKIDIKCKSNYLELTSLALILLVL